MTDLKKEVDLAEVSKKLYERLKPSGWAGSMKAFLLGSEFMDIIKELYEEARDGRRFTPTLKQVFSAFEDCSYGQLKVVILGQDPYPYRGVADGKAFSCGNDGVIQPSLRYIFGEIKATVYKDKHYDEAPDLTRWAKQGVLLLNTAFTTTIGEVGMHYKIWQPFLAYMFDILAFNKPGLIYVFMGKKAEGWARSVPDNNWKIYTTHPASAAHNRAERWDSNDVFNKINEALRKDNKPEIIW